MGLAVDDDAAAPAAAPAASANAPAVAAAAAPAMKAPVAIAPSEPPPPPPPESEWVTAAKDRKKVPYWGMPVLLFLPVWLIMYVGTLEEPTRNEGVLYEGGVVYEENCASCHGGAGGGGVGPAFTNGAIGETFASAEAQVAWVIQGSQVFIDDGRTTYGDNAKPLAGNGGALMPAFGVKLTAEELIAAVFYERIALGGLEDELPLAEEIWYKLDHSELDGEYHFIEGLAGDLDGDGEVAPYFTETRELLAADEVAAE